MGRRRGRADRDGAGRDALPGAPAGGSREHAGAHPAARGARRVRRPPAGERHGLARRSGRDVHAADSAGTSRCMGGRSLAAVGLCALVFGSCSLNDPPGGEGRLSIATGGSGGVYQVYGGGVAEMLSEQRPRHDRRDDVGVGRQPVPGRRRRLRRRVQPRRHRDRRRQGPGVLRRRRAAAARARHAVLELHARRRAEGLGDRADRGPEGQDGLDRRAELRHRGDRAAADGGRRPRSRRGRDAARDGRGGVQRGAARGLDRRLRVVRRPADRRDHRPRDHRRDRAAAARLLPAEAQRALRRGLHRGRGRGGRVPRRRRRSRRSPSRTC